MQRRKFIQSALLTPLLFPEIACSATRGSTDYEVINAGIGGNNTVDLLARIDKDCLVHQPELTVVMAGTNDMNSRKYISPGDFEKNLQSIIAKIKNIKSKILLMNLLPVYEPYLFTRHDPDFYKPEGHSGRLKQMNQLIKNVAATNKLFFLNLHHIFSSVGNIGLNKNSLIKNEANSNTTDGLHPTPDGYRVIGLAVYDYIMHQNISVKKIVCFGDSITLGDGIADGFNYPSYLKKLLSCYDC
jgi:lysophospholipase L1-like esterase